MVLKWEDKKIVGNGEQTKDGNDLTSNVPQLCFAENSTGRSATQAEPCLTVPLLSFQAKG